MLAAKSVLELGQDGTLPPERLVARRLVAGFRVPQEATGIIRGML